MIERSKSFSKGGTIIERVMQIERYKIDPDDLKQMLKPKIKSRLTQQPKDTINRFDLVTGRDKPSSFLLHNVKDANTHLDYQNKKDTVLVRSSQLPVRREKDRRLSLLLQPEKKAAQEQTVRIERHAKSCKRLKLPAQNEEPITIAGDLQNGRKTFHNMDFHKQTERPFDQTIRKLTMENQKQLITFNSTGDFSSRPQTNSLDKKDKIHAFQSYSKRQFLTEKKVKQAPEVSGQQWFKVNPEKFKSNWKTIQPPKFQEMAKKKLSRYDRDCPHWFTQLAYNVKNGNKSVKSQLNFQAQTVRQDNHVKSSYPIRLAV